MGWAEEGCASWPAPDTLNRAGQGSGAPSQGGASSNTLAPRARLKAYGTRTWLKAYDARRMRTMEHEDQPTSRQGQVVTRTRGAEHARSRQQTFFNVPACCRQSRQSTWPGAQPLHTARGSLPGGSPCRAAAARCRHAGAPQWGKAEFGSFSGPPYIHRHQNPPLNRAAAAVSALATAGRGRRAGSSDSGDGSGAGGAAGGRCGAR